MKITVRGKAAQGSDDSRQATGPEAGAAPAYSSGNSASRPATARHTESLRALGGFWQRSMLARVMGPQQVGLVLALGLLCLFFAVKAPYFVTSRNFINLLQSISYLGIIAMGMTLVILAGEIDISVGSAMAFYSALLGVLYAKNWPLWLVMVVVLALGPTIGGAAGFVRHKYGVPSFIVTLGLLSALSGAALWMTNAAAIPVINSAFAFIGSGDIIGIPLPVAVLAVTFAVFWFVAEKTTFGRSVYAVGGNAEAARVSGISLLRVRVIIFACTGFLAAVAAVETSSLIASGDPNIGNGAEFQVISAVIVGGTSLFGGRGRMIGTLLGIAFIGVLSNGLILMGVNQYAQEVVQGLIIVIAVLISERFRRGRGQSSS
jgi:ribose/xylose/arabinose/galactoside ABC-type transport system permease subunit